MGAPFESLTHHAFNYPALVQLGQGFLPRPLWYEWLGFQRGYRNCNCNESLSMTDPTSAADDFMERVLIEHPTEWREFMHAFARETDRGCVLAAGAMLDDLLADVLAGFFRDVPESAKLLGVGANESRDATEPLASFSARIRCAYALGLITDDERFDLEQVRHMRNRFAHEWRTTSLGLDAMRDRVLNLRYIPSMLRLAQKDETIATFRSFSTREQFTFAMAFLLPLLAVRAALVRKDRRDEWDHPRTRAPTPNQ